VHEQTQAHQANVALLLAHQRQGYGSLSLEGYVSQLGSQEGLYREGAGSMLNTNGEGCDSLWSPPPGDVNDGWHSGELGLDVAETAQQQEQCAIQNNGHIWEDEVYAPGHSGDCRGLLLEGDKESLTWENGVYLI
jgi:hypothetical protein